jgi:protein SCO1/2
MKPLLLLLACSLALRAAAAGPDGGVGFEQRIGETLPLGTLLTDAQGRERPLGALLAGRPAVLIFTYFRCPEMCSLVASGAIESLRTLKASAGVDYEVITVSFDPTDTVAMAREREGQDLRRYGRRRAAAGWHTLVGREGQVAGLAAAAGFHFRFDPASRQYAHPSGLVVITPRGVVSRYFLGVDFPSTDLAEALKAAAANETGSSVFSLLLVCFQGGGQQGRYSREVWILGQERHRAVGGAP